MTQSLALVGTGRMGCAVAEVARERGHRVVLEVGAKGSAGGAALSSKALIGVDLAIEFSTPAAAAENVRRCLEAGVGVVSGARRAAGQPGPRRAAGLARGGPPARARHRLVVTGGASRPGSPRARASVGASCGTPTWPSRPR